MRIGNTGNQTVILMIGTIKKCWLVWEFWAFFVHGSSAGLGISFVFGGTVLMLKVWCEKYCYTHNKDFNEFDMNKSVTIIQKKTDFMLKCPFFIWNCILKYKILTSMQFFDRYTSAHFGSFLFKLEFVLLAIESWFGFV